MCHPGESAIDAKDVLSLEKEGFKVVRPAISAQHEMRLTTPDLQETKNVSLYLKLPI